MHIVFCPLCGEPKKIEPINSVGNRIFCKSCKEYFLYSPTSDKIRPCHARETSSGLKFG